MTSPNDFNKQVIDEFRANQGKVGGPFESFDVLILHTEGAKSGAERVNPLVCGKSGEDIGIFASKGGADPNPAGYLNP